MVTTMVYWIFSAVKIFFGLFMASEMVLTSYNLLYDTFSLHVHSDGIMP